MNKINQISYGISTSELAYIISWLRRNNLYERLKKDLGIDNISENPNEYLNSFQYKIENIKSSHIHSWENCIATYYECDNYVEYRKEYLKQYLWLRRNNLLKAFQKEINYSKTDSITYASKYRGRGAITYKRCIEDWSDGNFKNKSDYYRCFSGNFKYLQRNNLLDEFLNDVLTEKQINK